MPYNWKCCSFYPNNFGASALTRSVAITDVAIDDSACFGRSVQYLLRINGNENARVEVSKLRYLLF